MKVNIARGPAAERSAEEPAPPVRLNAAAFDDLDLASDDAAPEPPPCGPGACPFYG